MAHTLETIAGFIARTDMGRKLTPEDCRILAPFLEVVDVEEEHCIIREGAPGDAWYAILCGEVCVTKRLVHGPPHVLSHLGAGECFGELALIDGSPRLASIHAVAETTVARLPLAGFERLLREYPVVAVNLVLGMGAVVAQRQRELTYILTDLLELDEPEAEPDPETLGAMLRSSMP